MASAPKERDPIAVNSRHGYGTTRHQLSPKTVQPFAFRDFTNLEIADEVVVVSGCSEVVIQGRMCGDFYAELQGPGFCVAAVDPNGAQALRNALARTPA